MNILSRINELTLWQAFLYLRIASTMRSRTRRSPLPHGTTTRTLSKQTVTFIIIFVYFSRAISETIACQRLWQIISAQLTINGNFCMVTSKIHFPRICVTHETIFKGSFSRHGFVDISLLSYRSYTYKTQIFVRSRASQYHGDTKHLNSFFRGLLSLLRLSTCRCVRCWSLFLPLDDIS